MVASCKFALAVSQTRSFHHGALIVRACINNVSLQKPWPWRLAQFKNINRQSMPSVFVFGEEFTHSPSYDWKTSSEWVLSFFWYLSSLTTQGVPPEFSHVLFLYIPCLQICLLLTFVLYHNYWITLKAKPNLISFLWTKLNIPQELVLRELILEGLPQEVEHMGV